MDMVKYIEKSGASVDDAVVILDVQDNLEGISAEYVYLESKFGTYGKDWDVAMQEIVNVQNRYYDRMALKFSDGRKQVIYFDITHFFGKM